MHDFVKSLVVASFATMMLVACGGSEDGTPQASMQWEYREEVMVGRESDKRADFQALTFEDPTPMLNKLGAQGWELVGTYSEVNTVFPCFGNPNYVNGLRDNARTNAVHFVFKRKIKQ